MLVGPYTVLSPLGHGGAGSVYRARARGGADVAVKLLRRASPEALARFERERRLLASFREEDGFVPLLDAGTSEQGPYIVMPLVEGGTLRDGFARGPFSVEEALELGRALGRALAAAHARGVVHRDLKPENVLYAADGRLLVADLGLAKHFREGDIGASRSVALSKTGEVQGTVGYMAPEQSSDAARVGPAADVFSLGAVLYEALTGSPAFVGATGLEVLAKAASGMFQPVRSLRPDAPPWLAGVIERALSPDPTKRPADGAAFLRALAPAASGRRTPLALALLLLVGGLAALGAGILRRDGRARPGEPAPAASAPPPSTPHDHARFMEEWKRLQPAGRVSEAGSLASEELRKDPGWAFGYYVRGTAAEIADPKAAIEDLDRAIALDPRLPEAYVERAMIRARMGARAAALADLGRATDLGATSAQAIQNRGMVLLELHDAAAALPDLERAVELDPDLVVAWINLGEARGLTGDLDGAIAACRRAIALHADTTLAWSGLGRWLGEKGEPRESIEACNRAIALAPGYPTSYGNRATARNDLGDADGALEDYDRAVACGTKDFAIYGNRAALRERKGDLAGAISDFEKFIELGAPPGFAASARQRIDQLRASLAK
jgi:serine/threonine protein kinase/Tfp pilus assembly protein PilF